MELQFIGHSAFYLKTDNIGILIDPFISQNPVAKFDQSKKVDYIFVTHGHADHLGDAIPISQKTGALITTIYELANYCAQRSAKTQGVNIGGEIKFSWGSARFFSATHSSSTPDGAYAGCPCSIMLTIGGVKIYHAGDTGLNREMKTIGELYAPDIVILPVGGIYTMEAKEASVAAEWLGAKRIIPMHYNSFEPIKVDKEVLEKSFSSKIELTILEPGESIKI